MTWYPVNFWNLVINPLGLMVVLAKQLAHNTSKKQLFGFWHCVYIRVTSTQYVWFTFKHVKHLRIKICVPLNSELVIKW